jgi:hypothetical protein
MAALHRVVRALVGRRGAVLALHPGNGPDDGGEPLKGGGVERLVARGAQAQN